MKIVRYFFVGGTAASVDLALFTALTQWAGFHWFPVAVASFVIATLLNYFLSILFVFESGARFQKQHEVMLVFFVSAIGLAANQTILWALIEVIGMHRVLAKIVATGGVFFWNFTARHLFIFRRRG